MNDKVATNRLPLRDLDKQPASAPLAASPRATDPAAITTGTKVSLNFALKLVRDANSPAEETLVIDSNLDSAAVSFSIGDGNLLPGFEQALLGSRAGDRIETVVPAAQAFGLVNPDNQQRFPRYTFPPDMALSENLLVEFADVSGYKQAGRIVQIGMHDVEIDFNHPLAGRDILFTAVIHRVDNVAISNEKQNHE